MLKKIVIKNEGNSKIWVMLEPVPEHESIDPGETVEITGDYTEDEEVVIEIVGGSAVGFWGPTDAELHKK